MCFALRGSVWALLLTAAPAAGKPVRWVSIESGGFTLGNPGGESTLNQPARWVQVPSFQIAKSAVTNDQYLACVNAGACSPPKRTHRIPSRWDYHRSSPTVWRLLPCMCPRGMGSRCPKPREVPYDTWQRPERGSHPVVCVSYKQAQTYAEWVGGRLPTEAEWEYAARWSPYEIASPDGYPSSSEAALGRFMSPMMTTPVCSYPQSAAGLCDMVGNVHEWVQDGFASYAALHVDPSSGVATPQAVNIPGEHVVRGGSWQNDPGSVSAVTRASAWGQRSYYWLGFRPVRAAPPPTAAPPLQLFTMLPAAGAGRRENAFLRPYRGKTKYPLYRIPALVATASGAVLAVMEGRNYNDHDWYESAITLMRSTNGGVSWEKERDVYYRKGMCSHTPALLLDAKTGRVHLFFSINPAGSKTKYYTAVLHVTTSDNDGRTWSKPRSLGRVVKPGPGHGIQLQYGKYKGRLLMPCRDTGNLKNLTPETRGTLSVYSDDGGATWRCEAEHTPRASRPPPTPPGACIGVHARGRTRALRAPRNTPLHCARATGGGP